MTPDDFDEYTDREIIITVNNCCRRIASLQKGSTMTRILIALMLLLCVPMQSWTKHKPMDKHLIIYIFQQMFKEVGGPQTVYIVLSAIQESKTDDDLEIVLKAAKIDSKKAMRAFTGASIVLQMVNGGILTDQAIAITKQNLPEELEKDYSAASILVLAFKNRGQPIDSTKVAKALRQAELLLHTGLDSKVAFKENDLDLNVLLNKED